MQVNFRGAREEDIFVPKVLRLEGYAMRQGDSLQRLIEFEGVDLALEIFVVPHSVQRPHSLDQHDHLAQPHARSLTDRTTTQSCFFF